MFILSAKEILSILGSVVDVQDVDGTMVPVQVLCPFGTPDAKIKESKGYGITKERDIVEISSSGKILAKETARNFVLEDEIEVIAEHWNLSKGTYAYYFNKGVQASL